MGVSFTHKGNFDKTENWFKKLLHLDQMSILKKYGEMGVNALRTATPIDTGLAASSWSYHIVNDGASTKIVWENSDIEGGCSVVVLVDRGHATKSGGWVPGQHFIDPAIEPIIKRLNDELWEEVTRV